MTKRIDRQLGIVGDYRFDAVVEISGTRWRVTMTAACDGLPTLERITTCSSAQVTRYGGLDELLALMLDSWVKQSWGDLSVLTDSDLIARVQRGLPMSWALAAQEARRAVAPA